VKKQEEEEEEISTQTKGENDKVRRKKMLKGKNFYCSFVPPLLADIPRALFPSTVCIFIVIRRSSFLLQFHIFLQLTFVASECVPLGI
jgi:hypothetical protein